jgi:type II secretory pathway predicted ATPase ExeA
MAQADASNLREAATHLVELIAWARQSGKRALIFLTGVPGSGKTLAGLQAIHDAIATGDEQQGDIVYLSGNTPLVTVLREALARNQHARHRGRKEPKSLHDIRRVVRTRIQHVNDFLKQVLHSDAAQMPYEHAIVFDEAQREWDEKQGLKKFSRTASEPAPR